MVSYTHAKGGYSFVPTDAGNKIGRIRSKYLPNHPMYKENYQFCVPTAWIKNGWVTEKSREEIYGKKA